MKNEKFGGIPDRLLEEEFATSNPDLINHGWKYHPSYCGP